MYTLIAAVVLGGLGVVGYAYLDHRQTRKDTVAEQELASMLGEQFDGGVAAAYDEFDNVTTISVNLAMRPIANAEDWGRVPAIRVMHTQDGRPVRPMKTPTNVHTVAPFSGATKDATRVQFVVDGCDAIEFASVAGLGWAADHADLVAIAGGDSVRYRIGGMEGIVSDDAIAALRQYLDMFE